MANDRILLFSTGLHPKNEQELLNYYLSVTPDQRRLLFASTAAAADNFGISQRTLQRWIEVRSILGIRVGRKYHVYLPAVERQITENSMRHSRHSRHSRNTPNGGLCHLADAPLTNRERQIARLVSEKLANKEIAEKLNISVGTVKIHVHLVLKKFGLQKRSYLTNYSHNDQGLI